jgi:hypothetical protein
MTLADELAGRVDVPDTPDAQRRVNLIDDADMQRASIAYVAPEEALGEIPEPAIGPFLVFGAKGEFVCPRTEERNRAKRHGMIPK